MKIYAGVLFLLLALPAVGAEIEIAAADGEWPVVAENQFSGRSAPGTFASRWKVSVNTPQGCKLGPCHGTDCTDWTYIANSVCRTSSDGVTKECVSDSNNRECAKKKDETTGLWKCETCIN